MISRCFFGFTFFSVGFLETEKLYMTIEKAFTDSLMKLMKRASQGAVIDKIDHQKFMKKALALAAKGAGHTCPNPMVGAVLVKKNKIIGKGYHKKYSLI